MVLAAADPNEASRAERQFHVAIIVCTRNRPDELRRCLAACLQSQVAPSVILVSDDSDESIRQLNGDSCAATVESGQVPVFHVYGPRRGLCANRNFALTALPPGCTHVAFVDDDVRISQDFIGTAIRHLSDLSGMTILTGWDLTRGTRTGPRNPTWLGHQEVEPRDGVPLTSVAMNTTVFPLHLFERVAFEEALRYGSDEVDICAQAISSGYQIVFRDDLWNEHTPAAANREEYTLWIERSRLIAAYRRLRLLKRGVLDAPSMARLLILGPLHLGVSRLKQTRQVAGIVSGTWAGLAALWSAHGTMVREVVPPLAGRPDRYGEAVSVIVPSYRRAAALQRCLDALACQTLRPCEVIAVLREEDADGTAVAAAHPVQPRVVVPLQSGQVAALNAGLEAATGGVVAITDDDTVPASTWIEQIVNHLEKNERLGGVGGRDVVCQPDGAIMPANATDVGVVRWYGRVVGNHHAGIGGARPVDVLKGANMAFRRAAITGLTFDHRLRGAGAQVCNDMQFSLRVRRRGWNLLYDSTLTVDHYPDVRYDADQRDAWSAKACADAAHNQLYALLTGLPLWRGMMAGAYAVIVGSRDMPGPALWLERVARGRGVGDVSRRTWAAARGRLGVVATVAAARRTGG